jgi:hypothetical protein
MMFCLESREPYYPATIRNSSIDGLYFVGPNAINTGDACHIVFEKDPEAITCPPDFKLCSATVKWSSLLSTDPDTAYGTGVQLDGWCRSLENAEIQRIFYRCDACEENTISCDVIKMNGPLFLCPKCYRRFQSIPDGPLKESYLRCLLGNVV